MERKVFLLQLAALQWWWWRQQEARGRRRGHRVSAASASPMRPRRLLQLWNRGGSFDDHPPYLHEHQKLLRLRTTEEHGILYCPPDYHQVGKRCYAISFFQAKGAELERCRRRRRRRMFGFDYSEGHFLKHKALNCERVKTSSHTILFEILRDSNRANLSVDTFKFQGTQIYILRLVAHKFKYWVL